MDSRDKFAQMLREGYEALDPEKEQREYIRELLRQKEQQRKRRIKTITAVAAAFLIVVGAVLAVGGCFGSVEADKNDRTKVEEQDGSVVISDENADGQEVMPETAMTTDWNKVDKLKEKYPEMITFTDVPKGMEFVSVEVKEESFDMINISYCFSYDKEDVLVFQKCYTDTNQQTQGISAFDKCIEYKKQKIYVNKKGESVEATIVVKNGVVDIIGKLKNKELFNMIDKIKASDLEA